MSAAAPGTGTMIEWTPFYRILGIQEEAGEPNAYQLLGLTDPRAVTADLVDEALQERKKLLRQNIPGPQFIPLVSVFEQKLDQAAEVLRDPERRRAYHERLLQQVHARRSARRRVAARVRQANAAAALIRANLAPDGTLDDAKRRALFNRLEEMGFSGSNIEATLSQIPRPQPSPPPGASAPIASGQTPADFFTRAVDLAIRGGLLVAADERNLLALAGKLGIPAEAAGSVIAERLEACGARRGEQDLAFKRTHFVKHVRSLCPDGRASARQRESLLGLAASFGLAAEMAERILAECLPGPRDDSDTPADENGQLAEIVELLRPSRPRTPGRIGRTVSSVAIPFIAIGVFTLFIMVYTSADIEGKTAGGALRSMAGQVSRLWSSPPDAPAPPAGDGSVAPKAPDITAGDRVGRQPVVQKQPDNALSNVPPTPKAIARADERSPEPPPRPRKDAPSDASARGTVDAPAAERLRRAYSDGESPEDLLADVVLALLAWCDRVSRLTGDTDRWPDELYAAIEGTDRTNALTRHVSVITRPEFSVLDPAASPGDSAALQELARGLLAPASGVRYRAIEELRIMGTPAAIEVLLGAFERKASADVRTASRILQALRTLRSPAIPDRLIGALPRCNSLMAHVVVRMLMEESGMPAGGGGPVLPRDHDRQQLEACAQRWQEARQEGRVSWGQAVQAVPAEASGGARDDDEDAFGGAAAPRDADAADLPGLVDAAIHYATYLGRALEAHSWDPAAPLDGEEPGGSASHEVVVGADRGEALVTAAEGIVSPLGRLVREHPEGAKFATRADVIELERRARGLASDTALQRVAVCLDAAARLSELLLEETGDGGRFAASVDELRRQREAAVAAAPDVLHEMRESAYYDVVLWDLIVRATANAELRIQN